MDTSGSELDIFNHSMLLPWWTIIFSYGIELKWCTNIFAYWMLLPWWTLLLHVEDDGTMREQRCWSLFDNLGKVQKVGIRELIGNLFFMIPKPLLVSECLTSIFKCLNAFFVHSWPIRVAGNVLQPNTSPLSLYLCIFYNL